MNLTLALGEINAICQIEYQFIRWIALTVYFFSMYVLPEPRKTINVQIFQILPYHCMHSVIHDWVKTPWSAACCNINRTNSSVYKISVSFLFDSCVVICLISKTVQIRLSLGFEVCIKRLVKHFKFALRIVVCWIWALASFPTGQFN